MKTDNSSETKSSQNTFAVVLIILNVIMIGAAVLQMILVGRRAYMSRQNSVLGIGKIDHTNDSDDIEEQSRDTSSKNGTDDTSVIPPRLTLRSRHSSDRKQTDSTADAIENEQQRQQSAVKF
jgi:hypothetical protein